MSLLQFIFLFDICVCQTWEEFDGIEYYYDGSSSGIVYSYDEAVNRCGDLDATLVIIKSPEVEAFISHLHGSSKYQTATTKIDF